MEKKQRFFIHDRREAAVLILLAVMVAVFAFTMGIHLGKKVATLKGAAHPVIETSPLASAPETAPQVDMHASSAATPSGTPGGAANTDEASTQALHDEVARTGIKIDQPRPVELPENTKSRNGGATTAEQPAAEEAEPTPQPTVVHKTAKPAAHHAAVPARHTPPAESGSESRTAVIGPFSLQVGSFLSRGEAQAHAGALNQQKASAFVQPADVPGVGMRFRVFIGNYATRDQAQKAAERFRARGLVDSFIVVRVGPNKEPVSPPESE